MSGLVIGFLESADEAAATDTAEELVALVNRAYAEAEKGLWVDGAVRTSAAELAELIAAREIVVARLSGRIVGLVRLQRLATGEAEFGMLVADPDHRGLGIGRELVDFAEQWALDQGLATVQLELLLPRDWTHPVKDRLRTWYTRIGYRPVRVAPFEDDYPALAPLLATPCDYVIFHKPVTVRRPGPGRPPQARGAHHPGPQT